jgi:hypothetical protein
MSSCVLLVSVDPFNRVSLLDTTVFDDKFMSGEIVAPVKLYVSSHVPYYESHTAGKLTRFISAMVGSSN